MLCVHIDHQLDAGSAERAERARGIAESLALPFCLETVSVATGENAEAAARRARYAALAGHVQAGDCLLTAHHADDQVETILLRLLRGAGPRGLGGIPRRRRFADGWLFRPLLDWSRRDLQAHCLEAGLSWIEDPTNVSLGADRNFLRHRVLPVLRERWPGLDRSIIRSGRLSAELSHAQATSLPPSLLAKLATSDRLDGEALASLTEVELGEVIRLWAQKKLGQPPPGKRLDEFLRQLSQAQDEQIPEMRWAQGRIRFWHRQLWLEANKDRQAYALIWSTNLPLKLPGDLGTLSLARGANGEVHDGFADAPQRTLQVRSGQPGERIRLGLGASRSRVKELLRTHGVPPWRRDHWPRVYAGNRLIALGARWIHPEFASWLENHRLELQWHRVDSAPDPDRRTRDQ